MNNKELIPALSTVLFAGGEPQIIDRLCDVLEIKESELSNLVAELNDNLKELGLRVVKLGNTYQMTTQIKYADPIKKMFDIKRKTPLSSAAFEVLAVVAYNQPITKAFIEQVRGVDCTGVVSTLVEKDLIEEQGRLDLPGRPLLYGTTNTFLRCFSLESLKDLPPLPKDLVGQAEQLVIDETLPETIIDEVEE